MQGGLETGRTVVLVGRLVAAAITAMSVACAPDSGSRTDATSQPSPRPSESASTAAARAPTSSASARATAVARSAAPDRPSVRCSAAHAKGAEFIGRVMKAVGRIASVDGLGLLFVTSRGDLYRVAKDAPLDPPLAREPPHERLIEAAEEHFITTEHIYYLEAQPRPPFNSRLLYLPAGVRPPPAPTPLANDIHHIIGEWDGWLYVLRRRPGFDTRGLTPKQIEAVGVDREHLLGYGGSQARWRFRYDLLRVKRDGGSELIGEVQRTVDHYYDGYVYGRNDDRGAKEVSVFRLPVTGGAPELLYRRPRRSLGYGGIPDGIGRVQVDRDGVFFLDHGEGLVVKLPHGGGEPEVLKRAVAYADVARLQSDYVLINRSFAEDQLTVLKTGKAPTWRSADDDPQFGKGRSGAAELFSDLFDGNVQYAFGRREAAPDPNGSYSFDYRPSGFVYEYLPGGTINARRFALRDGHVWAGALGADADCLYYTRSDGYNTWFYAMPKPSVR